MRAKEPWNVLDEPPRRRKGLGNTDELVEETGAVATEPSPLPSDGEILTGEPAAEEAESLMLPMTADKGLSDVSPPSNAGPSGSEDALAEGIVFDLEDDLMPRTFETQVEAAHA